MMFKESIIAIFVILLLGCEKDETIDTKTEIRGSFMVANESYDIHYAQNISFINQWRDGDVRIVFLSQYYPIEGEDVEDIHFIGVDFLPFDGSLQGEYQFSGDSSTGSMIFGYGGTNFTVRDQEFVEGEAYLFEEGSMKVSLDGDNYDIEFELIDTTSTIVKGSYFGKLY